MQPKSRKTKAKCQDFSQALQSLARLLPGESATKGKSHTKWNDDLARLGPAPGQSRFLQECQTKPR
eukprot:13629779-Heterocapsa_arctica.AAC.1